MSRVGDCWDNAVVESFFATLTEELLIDAVLTAARGESGGVPVHQSGTITRRTTSMLRASYWARLRELEE